MENKARKKRGAILGAAALAALLGGVLSLSLRQSRYEAWAEEMLHSGPWAEESIWTAEHGEAYLVSRRGDDGEMAVRLYYSEGGLRWVPADLALGEKKDTACFTADHQRVEGELELEEGTLSFWVTDASGEDARVWEDVELVFTQRDGTGTNLPFCLESFS